MPMSWRSFPTPRRSCAWPPPWSSNLTTNGRSPAATSPMSPWENYAPSSPPNTPLQHLQNNTKSPSVQHDSLITTREPRQIRSPPTHGTLSSGRDLRQLRVDTSSRAYPARRHRHAGQVALLFEPSDGAFDRRFLNRRSAGGGPVDRDRFGYMPREKTVHQHIEVLARHEVCIETNRVRRTWHRRSG